MLKNERICKLEIKGRRDVYKPVREG